VNESTRFWRIGKKNFPRDARRDARRDKQYSLIGGWFGVIQAEKQ
jgi:hypothetical protein